MLFNDIGIFLATINLRTKKLTSLVITSHRLNCLFQRNKEDLAVNLKTFGAYIRKLTDTTTAFNFMEILLSCIQHPAASIFLIILMIGGLIAELQVPGKIIPLLVSLLAAAAYFVPFYWTGTMATWELFLFVVGFILLLLEIFVIPGFGLTGIIGFITLFLALGLVTLNNNYLDFSEVTAASLKEAVAIVLVGALGSLILLFWAANSFVNSPYFNKFGLHKVLDKESGYVISNLHLQNLIGQKGIAYSVLRPTGKILVGDQLYDASTKNQFVEKGQNIEVIAIEGTFLQVRVA
jgi:membrane-bound serine protease (ClpP class)